MTYSCERIGNSIILFGLARPVYHNPKRAEGLTRYCSARDQHGNLYDVYTDYDPCIAATRAVAIIKEV